MPTPSLRGALATKQSRLPPRRVSGLLRYARNDEERERLPPTSTRTRASQCRGRRRSRRRRSRW
ncbi:hypothetical protein EAS61_08045 [Bradyrhizobium zhanjiangense]|uniref:Uncharacterized protein n=1 Tax=Bradyrhizobium zhanjiangense TaxID=1325107 RepID=A0A4Q0QV26_9BRAD|nr:hypothetical protein EAS61_08045 [Bradyrhizobium zhanjiangense]